MDSGATTDKMFGEGAGREAPSEAQLRGVKDLQPRDPAAANRLLAKLEGKLLDTAAERGVARYVPLEKIGAGGLGTVYAAYDPELDRKVAVKFVRTDPEGINARARLVREAQAMAQLNHPNVVAVHDVGTVGNEVFIAMELVEGVTLSGWWRADRRSWKQVRDVMLQAGRGVAAAHAAGLVHRDFKPPNVLVGQDGRVRVLDFGLARTWQGGEVAPSFVPSSDRGIDASLTDSRMLLGTPAYMAPEQINGGVVGPAADQFAFCATLFEGLYGFRPFQGDDISKVLEAVVRGAVARPPPSARVPAWLHRVVMRGLSGKPEDRFASMDALLHALQHDVRSRRKQWLVAAAVAVASAVTALLVVFLLRPTPTAEDRRRVAAWVEAATAAAEDGRYVYPDPDAAEEVTAYQWVRRLEGTEGSGARLARDAAHGLRHTFASALVADGDALWGSPEGRAFATDYYAMALVFEPDRERARARSARTPGEVASLRERAVEGDFSEAELVAAAPLHFLNEADADLRRRALQAYEARAEASPIAVAKVRAAAGRGRSKPSRPKATAPTGPKGAATQAPGQGHVAVEAREPSSADSSEATTDAADGPVREASRRLNDRALAKRLTAEGNAQVRAGDRAGAKKTYTEALAADARYAPAAYELAKVFLDLQQRASALRYAKRAVALARGNANYHVLLADLHAAAFDQEQARAHYRIAADLGHKRARAKLEALGGKP